MSKKINEYSAQSLLQYFVDKGCDVDKQFLLAIDCDRTIVDRKAGAHHVSHEVVQMFKKLQADKRFVLLINTGRDLTSYYPVQVQISHSSPCLFLSGRVLHLNDHSVTLPMASLPKKFCNTIWNQFIEGAIPFLDVKHDKGNTFFNLKERCVDHYFGLYKPTDWFEGMTLHFSEQREHFFSLNVVRMELPFLKSKHGELVNAINNNDEIQIKKLMNKFFGVENSEQLEFIPVKTHSKQPKFQSEIAYIRVIVNPNKINKGTGIKHLIDHLKIPESNVICFGDSAGVTACDTAVKQILPKSTLMITEDGDENAFSHADFLIQGVSEEGVPKAASLLIQAFDAYNKFRNLA